MYADIHPETEAMAPHSREELASGFFAAVGRLVESLVAAHARQLPPPGRELPPEWFQYPIV